MEERRRGRRRRRQREVRRRRSRRRRLPPPTREPEPSPLVRPPRRAPERSPSPPPPPWPRVSRGAPRKARRRIEDVPDPSPRAKTRERNLRRGPVPRSPPSPPPRARLVVSPRASRRAFPDVSRVARRAEVEASTAGSVRGGVGAGAVGFSGGFGWFGSGGGDGVIAAVVVRIVDEAELRVVRGGVAAHGGVAMHPAAETERAAAFVTRAAPGRGVVGMASDRLAVVARACARSAARVTPPSRRGMRSALYISKGVSRRFGTDSSNALTSSTSSRAAFARGASAAAVRESSRAPRVLAILPGRTRGNTVTARVPEASEPSLRDPNPSLRAASCTCARSADDNPAKVGASPALMPSFATRSANVSNAACQSEEGFIAVASSVPTIVATREPFRPPSSARAVVRGRHGSPDASWR